MSALKENFGKRLRYLRRDRDLTQEKLADLLGLSAYFVRQIEKGEAAPSFDTLEKLAQVLGVEVAELFRFSQAKLDASSLPDV